MSGAKGMLPTVFDVEPSSKADRIHQAEKPVELLKQIMEFITEEKEWGTGPVCRFFCFRGSSP